MVQGRNLGVKGGSRARRAPHPGLDPDVPGRVNSFGPSGGVVATDDNDFCFLFEVFWKRAWEESVIYRGVHPRTMSSVLEEMR